jgi:hypothetical protein
MDAGPQGGTCWRAAGYRLERVALFSINCLQRLVAMYDLLVFEAAGHSSPFRVGVFDDDDVNITQPLLQWHK